jgi:hypothetical protein
MLEVIVGQSIFLETSHFEILDYNIGYGNEPAYERLAGALRHINRNRSLIAVRGNKIRTEISLLAVLPPEVWRTPTARIVSGSRMLDLDDVCA